MSNLKRTLLITILITMTFLQAAVTSLYQNTVNSFEITDNNLSGLKKGESVSYSIFSMIAVGDSGIKRAAENGGITEVVYVDRSYTAMPYIFVYVFSKEKTIVYGK